MARPMYNIEKDGVTKTVKSVDMLVLTKQGWTNLGAVSLDNNQQPVHTQEVKHGNITPQFTPKLDTNNPSELETSNNESNSLETTPPKKLSNKQPNKSSIKTSNTKNTNNNKSRVPKDLICPHCSATARTEDSYKKNHGDNCIRKVK